MVRGVTADLETRQIATIHKRLVSLQKNASLSARTWITSTTSFPTDSRCLVLPNLLDDTRATLEKWGSSGKFDPFENVYQVDGLFHINVSFWHICSSQLTFQLTVRSLSASEIAQDPSMVSRLKALYDRLDSGTTPASVLLPWLPSPAMIRKLWATKEIYSIISKVVRERAASGRPGNDTLQMLLDCGDKELIIVGVSVISHIRAPTDKGLRSSWWDYSSPEQGPLGRQVSDLTKISFVDRLLFLFSFFRTVYQRLGFSRS
jgi:sterol 14-demethylase